MSTYNKPLPNPTAITKPFWDYCKHHELRIQRCRQCNSFRHYPQAMCPYCNSVDTEWAKASGMGKVYTWTVCYQAFHTSFAPELPYTVVTIELDEGVRMVSRVIDIKPEDLSVGMPVRVVFDDVNDDFSLPVFQRV